MFAKFRGREILIKIGSNLDFNAFFASLFCFANLENFIYDCNFCIWQSCIFHFLRPREISPARKTHRNSQVPQFREKASNPAIFRACDTFHFWQKAFDETVFEKLFHFHRENGRSFNRDKRDSHLRSRSMEKHLWPNSSPVVYVVKLFWRKSRNAA